MTKPDWQIAQEANAAIYHRHSFDAQFSTLHQDNEAEQNNKKHLGPQQTWLEAIGYFFVGIGMIAAPILYFGGVFGKLGKYLLNLINQHPIAWLPLNIWQMAIFSIMILFGLITRSRLIKRR
jgi:hypothetical protein